jgi:hypothetical protein
MFENSANASREGRDLIQRKAGFIIRSGGRYLLKMER